MNFQFNSTEPGQAPRRQRRRLRMPGLGVVAYAIALAGPLLLLPAAYIKANVTYLGDDFRHAVQYLFVVPLIGLLMGIITLLRRSSPSSRRYAKAAIVVGLFGMGLVSFHGDEINEFETRQHKSTCLNNLRKIGEALQLYSSEYNDMLPSSYLYCHSKTWSPSDFTAFASRRGDLKSGSKGSRMTWPMLLYRYNPDERMMWCPSDPNALDDSPNAVVSYYWKAAIDRAWYGGFRRLSDFPYRGDQVLAYERLGWHFGPTEYGLSEETQVNAAFLDGHVETILITQSGYNKSENPPGPLPKSGVGEPAWFNCPVTQIELPQNSRTCQSGAYWNPKQWVDSR